MSLRGAWSWRRTRNSQLSVHAAHSLALRTGDGVRHVTGLTLGISIGRSITETAQSLTVIDNVAHTMPEYLPREQTVRNDGELN
jgi:hypothetical protein